jgi:hypothetical protein
MRIYEGSRNHELTRRAGAARRGGLSSTGLLAALRAENREVCVPPLPEREVDAMVASIERNWPAGGSPLDKPGTFAGGTGNLTPAAKYVLVLLAEHADYRGRVQIGMRRLAQLGDLDLGTVNKAVNLLAREGRLTVASSGPRSRNSYTLTGFADTTTAVL